MVHIATTKTPAYQEAYAQRTTRDASPLVAQALGTTTSVGRNDPSLASRLPGTEAGATTETEAGQADTSGVESSQKWQQNGAKKCDCGKPVDSSNPEAGLNGDSAGFDQESITPPVPDSIEPVE